MKGLKWTSYQLMKLFVCLFDLVKELFWHLEMWHGGGEVSQTVLVLFFFNSKDTLLFSETLDNKCFCNCYHTTSARSESHQFMRYRRSDLCGVKMAVSFEVIIAEQIYVSYKIWPNWLTDYCCVLPLISVSSEWKDNPVYYSRFYILPVLSCVKLGEVYTGGVPMSLLLAIWWRSPGKLMVTFLTTGDE